LVVDLGARRSRKRSPPSSSEAVREEGRRGSERQSHGHARATRREREGERDAPHSSLPVAASKSNECTSVSWFHSLASSTSSLCLLSKLVARIVPS